MRFQSDNPLDLAHDEHVVKEAASHISAPSTAVKRPRMVGLVVELVLDHLQ